MSAARAKRKEEHNRRTHIHACNLNVGKYVLWGTSQHDRLPKLTLRWKGPYQIVTLLSDFLFIIKNLKTGKDVVQFLSSVHFGGVTSVVQRLFGYSNPLGSIKIHTKNS